MSPTPPRHTLLSRSHRPLLESAAMDVFSRGPGPRLPAGLLAAAVVAGVFAVAAWADDDAANVRFGGTSATPSAADAPLVATPQHAVLLLSTTDTRRIWVEKLLPGELVYRDAEHTDVPARLAARPNVKAGLKLLSGDVFRIDPRTGRFNRFDELTGRFAPLRTGRDHDTAAGDDGPGEIHTEIAEGTGTDPAAALADAFRNAVRQAVGVYVDSETLTNKEEIVADKVLTFSDAFIVRYEELTRGVEDGLVTVKISAAIQVGKLMTNLREAKINTIQLAGSDLVAAALTRQEAKDAAAQMLSRKFHELPGTLAAEALPFKPLDYDAKTQLLTVTYSLHADRDKYKEFLASLEPLVQQVALAKTSLLVKVDPIWSDNTAPIWQDDSAKKRLVAAQAAFTPGFRYGPNLASLPGTWCLWVMTRWDANHRNTQWQGYALDVDLPKTLGDVTGTVEVRLELLDARGEVVKAESHDPLKGLARPAYWFGWARPRPRLFLEKNPRSWPALGACPSAPILLVTFLEEEFRIDRQSAVNVYVSPMCYAMPPGGMPVLAPGAWQVFHTSIGPDDLARVVSIRATPRLVPPQASAAPAGAGPGPQNTLSPATPPPAAPPPPSADSQESTP